jgi:hypothetical protein
LKEERIGGEYTTKKVREEKRGSNGERGIEKFSKRK